MIVEDLGLLFFTALLLSLLLTPMSITLAKQIGAIDSPVDRSQHTQAMPRLGGLGMTMAALVSLSLFLSFDASLIAMLLGGLMIMATGLLDDMYQISPAKKMLGQAAACLIFLIYSGLSIPSLGNLVGLGVIDFYPFISIIITLFFMLGIINAFNLSDGLDGLAAGLAILAAIFMAILALLSHNWLALSVIVALVGGILGFLKYNSHPAKLFMGDTGSLSLGYFMACLVVILSDFDGLITIEPVTLLMVLALPIADTVLVMSRRMLKGESPVCADRTHLHHRLLALGFSHGGVVILIYFIGFGLGTAAIALHNDEAWLQFATLFLLAALLYMPIFLAENKSWNLGRFPKLQAVPQEIKSGLVVAAGRSVAWLRLTIIVGLLLPVLFVSSSPAETRNLLIGVLIILLVAFPWRDHKEQSNIMFGLFYMAGLAILFVWNVSSFAAFDMGWYTLGLVVVLSLWALFKIRFKGHHEVFFTSGFEVLLIVLSWFVPYLLLPVLHVSDVIMAATKTSCLEAIPLFIAMKIVIRKQPHRNHMMAFALISIIALMILSITN